MKEAETNIVKQRGNYTYEWFAPLGNMKEKKLQNKMYDIINLLVTVFTSILILMGKFLSLTVKIHWFSVKNCVKPFTSSYSIVNL